MIIPFEERLTREECKGDEALIRKQVIGIFNIPDFDADDKMMVFCIGGYTDQDLDNYNERINNDGII